MHEGRRLAGNRRCVALGSRHVASQPGDAHDPVTERRFAAGGARTGEDHNQVRYPRRAGARGEGRAQAGGLFHCRYRCTRYGDGVLVRHHGPDRQRLSPPRGEVVQGAGWVAAGAAEYRPGHVVPGHVREDPASAAAGGGGIGRGHAPAGGAHAAGDGQHGHRLHRGVSDADAAAGDASAGRSGGRAGACVQSLAGGGAAAAGARR